MENKGQEREREVNEMMNVTSRKNPWSELPFGNNFFGVVMIWNKVKRVRLRGNSPRSWLRINEFWRTPNI